MENSTEIKDALDFLYKNYSDDKVNNNKYIISTEEILIQDNYISKSMKQSAFKNVIYKDSIFENVALTGSTFDKVKFINTKLIGNSFANCNFYNTEILGSSEAFTANNFSQSNFENCLFKSAKLFRSGILNTLFHRCQFTENIFQGSTLEGTQFISCNFNNCDFSNVNLDYTLFSKNIYNNLTFPFYQIAYIIGAADFICESNQNIFAKAGDKKITIIEYLKQIDNLILYYLDKDEFFPTCNLYIVKKDYNKAKEYLIQGILKSLENKNFRMISNFCRLAKYHGIADETIKNKIMQSMDDFIQSNNIPESQLNYYLIYIGNIKALLNEGASNTVTLNYSIKTNTSKNNAEGVKYVNEMLNKFNIELSKLNGIHGYEVSIANHSPFEIVLNIISSIIAFPSAVYAVMEIVTKIKNSYSKKNKEDIIQIDVDTQRKYIDERIERMKNEMLVLNNKFKNKNLKKHIVEVTQSLKTDLEELYTKDVMIFKIRKKED